MFVKQASEVCNELLEKEVYGASAQQCALSFYYRRKDEG
jgi:hypothetical protein